MARRALCVGINDYPGDEDDLRGCVNDAKAWSELLIEHFQFPKSNVALLLDGDATKARIVTALKKLVTEAEAGDVIVFTNSSHGTYVAAAGGDEAYDEAICPFDCDEGESKLLLDDELYEIFGRIAEGASFTVISDSCHSGSLTRAVAPQGAGGRKARFLDPRRIGLRELRDADSARSKSRAKRNQGAMRELLLSGCTQREYSWDDDLGGVPHGAMTYYALQSIRAADYSITWEDLHQRVRSRLDANGYPQHPQLEGTPENKKKPIFT
jgi:uncharacterized caspase-like protein